jgi:hypothetical protein
MQHLNNLKIISKFNFLFSTKIIYLFLITGLFHACKKNDKATGNTEIIKPPLPVVTISDPIVINGVLKFENSESFFKYRQNANGSNIGLQSRGGFVSMQDAFNQLLADEETITASLELQYPAGPASVYDNTHSLLTATYPNSFYVAGNDAEGYYYEINTFDRSVSDKINADGIVAIDSTIVQYTKDYYKVWINGDISNTSLLRNTNSSTSDIIVINIKSSISISEGHSRAPQLWLPNLFWNRSCQNTVRVGGRNRRVIGYIDFNNYRINPYYVNYIVYNTRYFTTSRSLKGRLFGVWYDNWYTGHQQKGSIVGNFTSGVGRNIYTGQWQYTTVNWNDGFDIVKNNVTEWVIYEPDNRTNERFLDFPDNYTYSIPQISSHYAYFLAATGYLSINDNPHCSCNK